MPNFSVTTDAPTTNPSADAIVHGLSGHVARRRLEQLRAHYDALGSLMRHFGRCSCLRPASSELVQMAHDFREEVLELRAWLRVNAEHLSLFQDYVDFLHLSPSHQEFLDLLGQVEVVAEQNEAHATLATDTQSSALVGQERNYDAALNPETDALGLIISQRHSDRVVMIGAGPLPITAHRLSQAFPDLQAVALDNDEPCFVEGSALLQKLGSAVEYHLTPGESFAFRPTDAVLVAVMVVNRVEVLHHLLACGVDDVLVRVPTGVAALCNFRSTVDELETTGYVVRDVVGSDDAILWDSLWMTRKQQS